MKRTDGLVKCEDGAQKLYFYLYFKYSNFGLQSSALNQCKEAPLSITSTMDAGST